jgi:hypothetical protein
MKKIILCLYAGLLTQSNLFYANLFCEQKYIVIDSVADLRTEMVAAPRDIKSPALSTEIGTQQDKQAIYGECIVGEQVAENSDWVKGYSLGQKAWKNGKWVGFPCFILRSSLRPVTEFPKYNVVLQKLWTPLFSDTNIKSSQVSELPLGTRLETKKINDNWLAVVIDGKIEGYLENNNKIYALTEQVFESEETLRDNIVKMAYLLKASGSSYVWGGRSPFNPNFSNQITGVDCSGMFSLIMLAAAGLEIPSDAGPQFRSINKLDRAIDLQSGKELLQKADFVFFARDEQGTRIHHVMMYVGNGKIIECSGHGFSSSKDVYNPDINKSLLNDDATQHIEFKDFWVREKYLKDFTGVDVGEIESGKTKTKTGSYVFLGSYFGSNGNLDKIHRMRLIALGQNLSEIFPAW